MLRLVGFVSCQHAPMSRSFRLAAVAADKEPEASAMGNVVSTTLIALSNRDCSFSILAAYRWSRDASMLALVYTVCAMFLKVLFDIS